MSTTAPVHVTAHSEPTLVVFGRDGTGKPRASWFDAVSAELAAKAADLMKMRVLRIETDEQKTLARQLARGRVFASGRPFTPFARAPVFNKLVELADGATGHMMARPTAGSEDHAGVENSGASASAVPHGSSPSQAAGRDPAQPSTISAPVRPQGWDQIGIGSVVLATVGVEDGWWEAVVLGVNGGACTLKWRDFPRERTFVRRRTELALLPATAS